MSLGGCSSYGTEKPVVKAQLTEIPQDIKDCIRRQTKKPVALETAQQAADAIKALRRSEVAKTRCGSRLLKLYEGQL